jgi:hypothetical protein
MNWSNHFAIEQWHDSKAATAGYMQLSNDVIQKQRPLDICD